MNLKGSWSLSVPVKMEVMIMGENREYSSHPYFSYYSAMLSRAERLGVPCDYERDLESFNRFLKDIGQIPENMVKPTVGRNDHSKGYIIENGEPNFKWQEKSDNSREVALRTRLAGRQFEAGTHNTQTGTSGFYTGAAGRIGGRRTGALGKSGFQTGIAGRAGGVKGIKAQLDAGTHISQTGKTAFHSGAAGKASTESANSINKQFFTCPACGNGGRGPWWKHHVNKLVCQSG